MKRFLLTLIPMTLAGALHASPIVVTSPVDHLFVPKGFDNNDNVELMVSGKFPNTCYSRNKVEVKVVEDKINIQISALMSDQGANCETFDVSFMENVTVGNLQAGQYQISVNDTLKEEMIVSESSSDSVDDHLYAMVHHVDLGFTGGLAGDVRLVGTRPNCIGLDHIEIISNDKDTFSILPIMKKVANDCTKQKVYFDYPVRFNPRAIKNKKILLFVRTMDGKSVSALVER